VRRIDRTNKIVASLGGSAIVSQLKIKKTPKLIKFEENKNVQIH